MSDRGCCLMESYRKGVFPGFCQLWFSSGPWSSSLGLSPSSWVLSNKCFPLPGVVGWEGLSTISEHLLRTKYLHSLSRCILSWLPLAGLPCHPHWWEIFIWTGIFLPECSLTQPCLSSWESASLERMAGTASFCAPFMIPCECNLWVTCQNRTLSTVAIRQFCWKLGPSGPTHENKAGLQTKAPESLTGGPLFCGYCPVTSKALCCLVPWKWLRCWVSVLP